MTQTLFLKYRPQVFDDLVGQETVVRTLKNALKAEKPAHAYLFAGSRGTGKTTTARLFAKGLNCTNLKDGAPCGTCDMCVGTARGTLVDVIEIDAASNRGIDEIRDLREKIQFSPAHAKRKIYVIDEVHMLTKDAFNALLKTLEEPPAHAHFVLATTELHKIPDTIISRCQVFTFGRFTLDQLTAQLGFIAGKESIKTEPEALQLIARKAEGGMRDAIGMLEQLSAETGNNITADHTRDSLGVSSPEMLSNLWNNIQNQDLQAGFATLRTLTAAGTDLRTFGHDMLGYLRDRLHQNLQDPAATQPVLAAIEAFQKALKRLKTSPIVELPLEIALVELAQTNLPAYTPAPPAVPATKPAPVTPSVPKAETTTVQKSDVKPEPKPEVKVAEVPAEAKPKPTPSGTGFNTADITKALPEAAKTSGMPVFAKKSLLTMTVQVEGVQVTLVSDSEFHREKVQSSLPGLTKALRDMFGDDLMIQTVKNAVTTQKHKAKGESDTAEANDFLVF